MVDTYLFFFHFFLYIHKNEPLHSFNFSTLILTDLHVLEDLEKKLTIFGKYFYDCLSVYKWHTSWDNARNIIKFHILLYLNKKEVLVRFESI